MKKQLFKLLEAGALSQGQTGGTWEVTIMAFGRSSRPPHYVYTKEAALRSLSVFEGARVYALRATDDGGHAKNPNSKSVRDIVGSITNVRVTDSELRGDLDIFPSAAWLKDNLNHTASKNLPPAYELSIDASGKGYLGRYEGKSAPIVESFDRAAVDVVERGAAGGKFLRMVASQIEGDTPVKQKLMALFALLYPRFLESKQVDLAAIDENELFTHLLEADKPQGRLHLPDGAQLDEKMIDEKLTKIRESLVGSGDSAIDKLIATIDKALTPAKAPEKKADNHIELDVQKMQESATNLSKQIEALEASNRSNVLAMKLTESKLPVPLQEHVRELLKDRKFEAADVDATIKSVRATFSKFVESNVDNRGLDVRMGMEGIDKVALGIEGFFMSRATKPTAEEMKPYKDIPPFKSFKEAYIQLTGDVEVSGRVGRQRFTESLATTDWTNVVSTAMNKRLVRDYNLMALDTWRNFTDVIPLTDFKQQQRVRYGGYSNLPIVNQGNGYQPLASPSDEKATYTPAKRGGTEDLTREMIMNDDLKAISGIPQHMARAAAQTLHEFVYDLIKPAINGTIYDSQALYYAATHYNTATSPLASDGAALAAARLRMRKQKQKDNAKPIGIRAQYVVVPSDLQQTAYALVAPAYGVYNQVPTFLQQLNLSVIVVDYWTDATDWVLVAMPQDVIGLEVGFVNGQETPELFASDIPNVGSLFTNDKITYKIRHEYGAVITDWRAFDGSIVAG